MLLQRITNYLLRHRFQALALTFFITFIPIIRVAGILIAGFMTLIKGAIDGFFFTLAVLVSLAISFTLMMRTHDMPIPAAVFAVMGASVLLSNLLTWVFAVLVRRQMSWSKIIQMAALGGAFIISIVHTVYPNIAEWWAMWAIKLQSQVSMNVSPNQMIEAINDNKPYATGIAVTAVLVVALSQAMIVKWWQAVLYSPGALRRGLQSIRLSYLAGVLFLGSLVLAYLGNSVILDIMPVLYALFFGAGLSLIHYFCRMIPAGSRWIWISVIYVAGFLTMPISIMLVAGLAVADIGLDLRKRFSKA
jgi:hypothetical protein